MKPQNYSDLKRRGEEAGNSGSALDLYMKNYVFATFGGVIVVATGLWTAYQVISGGCRDIKRSRQGEAKPVQPDFYGKQDRSEQNRRVDDRRNQPSRDRMTRNYRGSREENKLEVVTRTRLV